MGGPKPPDYCPIYRTHGYTIGDRSFMGLKRPERKANHHLAMKLKSYA
jgi:hypothetical protein